MELNMIYYYWWLWFFYSLPSNSSFLHEYFLKVQDLCWIFLSYIGVKNKASLTEKTDKIIELPPPPVLSLMSLKSKNKPNIQGYCLHSKSLLFMSVNIVALQTSSGIPAVECIASPEYKI